MEQEKKPYDHAFAFKDNASIAETFVDGIHLVTMDGSIGRIVFTVSRSDPPKQATKSPSGSKNVALRLVMPMSGMAELYNQLHRMMAGMEQMGLIQREGSPPITRN